MHIFVVCAMSRCAFCISARASSSAKARARFSCISSKAPQRNSCTCASTKWSRRLCSSANPTSGALITARSYFFAATRNTATRNAIASSVLATPFCSFSPPFRFSASLKHASTSAAVMVCGPNSIAFASTMNRRNCSKFILSTSRISTSPSLSYSLNRAWSPPACARSAARAAASSSARAFAREEDAPESPTSAPIPNASKSSLFSSHATPAAWCGASSSVCGSSRDRSPFAGPSSVTFAAGVSDAGGVVGRPSHRTVNASGPRLKRTTTPSPSAYRARIIASTSSTMPSRFITACGTNVPAGRFARCATRSHAANASQRKICSPFPQSTHAVATSPFSWPSASVGRRLTLSFMGIARGRGPLGRTPRKRTSRVAPGDLARRSIWNAQSSRAIFGRTNNTRLSKIFLHSGSIAFDSPASLRSASPRDS